MSKQNFVKKGFWGKVKKYAGKVPFIRDAIAMYHSMLDSDTPLNVKITIAGALAYFIMPLDAIPDFLAGIGYLDDAGIVASALTIVSNYVTKEHYNEADDFLQSN